MNFFSRKKKIPSDIEVKFDGDMWGQLSHQSWSCVVLDGFGELLKYAGLRGKELYYRMAQQAEAFFTTFEGEGEDVAIKNVFEFYVWPNIISKINMYDEFGQIERVISKQEALISGFLETYRKYFYSKWLEASSGEKRKWSDAMSGINVLDTYFKIKKGYGVALFWSGYYGWLPDATKFLDQIPVSPLPSWFKSIGYVSPYFWVIGDELGEYLMYIADALTDSQNETFASQFNSIIKLALEYTLSGITWE